MALNFEQLYASPLDALLRQQATPGIFDQIYSGPAGIVDPVAAQSVAAPAGSSGEVPFDTGLGGNANPNAPGFWHVSPNTPTTPTTPTTPPAQNLPDQWWINPWFAHVQGWGTNPNNANSSQWRPGDYTDPTARQNAWVALGRPDTDYQGNQVSGQFGGGSMQTGPNTPQFAVQRTTPAAPMATTPATPTTPTTPATTPTTPTTPTDGLTPNQQSATPTYTGIDGNQSSGGQVVTGQLNPDLTVSNPRRRVANAMIVRR